MMAVVSKPIKRPVNGFAVARSIASERVEPNWCNEEIIKSSENKNTNRPTKK